MPSEKGTRFEINFMPYGSPNLIGEIRHTPIYQSVRFYVMIETVQFNGNSVGFRDLGLNPSSITFCVVFDKFFNLSVSYYPQMLNWNKLYDLLQKELP